MFNILYDCMGFLLLKVLLGNHLMIILGTWSNEYEQALHLPFWMLSHVWSYSMNTTQTSPAHVYVDNMDSLGSGGPRDHDRDYIVQLCGAANVIEAPDPLYWCPRGYSRWMEAAASWRKVNQHWSKQEKLYKWLGYEFIDFLRVA